MRASRGLNCSCTLTAVAYYLRLGDRDATYMLREEDDPEEVGKAIAAAHFEGQIAQIRWQPIDGLEPAFLWVDPRAMPYWQIVEHHEHG